MVKMFRAHMVMWAEFAYDLARNDSILGFHFFELNFASAGTVNLYGTPKLLTLRMT